MNTEILNKIKKESKTNEKIFLAVNSFTDKEHEFMEECFNNIIYNISETNIAKAINYDSFKYGKFEDLGEFLEKYPISENEISSYSIKQFIKIVLSRKGNDQIKILNLLLRDRVGKSDAPWYIRVLLKNPRIGISQTTYNKIRIKQGLNPMEVFYVKLAKLLEPENFNTLKYPVYCEIKYDGERAIINYNDGKVTITSRNGNDITSQFPEIVEEIKNYFKNSNFREITLDGEIVSKSFNSLQKRMNRLEKNIEIDYDITFICFDVIDCDKQSFRNKSQVLRRNILRDLKNKYNLKLSECDICKTQEEVYTFYKVAIENEQEGIIIKEYDAKWALKPDDRDNWYKVKPVYTSDLEIVKAENGKGKNKDYINIIYVKDYTGRIKTKVSSGMTDELRQLFTYMNNKEELIGKIVEIKYNQITDTNSLRHPRIIKLRLDKNIADKL